MVGSGYAATASSRVWKAVIIGYAAVPNRRRYYLDDIERIVVSGLREHLGTREAIAYYVKCYNEERRRVANAPANRRRDMEKEITQIDRQIQRAVSAIIEGRITEAEASHHLPALRQRKTELAVELGALATHNIITLRPAAVDAYLLDLSRLDTVINADLAEGDQTAALVVRQMIETVTITSTARGEVPGVIVRGQLGSISGWTS